MAPPHPGRLPFLSTFFLLMAFPSGPQFPSQPGCVYGGGGAPLPPQSLQPLLPVGPVAPGLAAGVGRCSGRMCSLGVLPGSVPSSEAHPRSFSGSVTAPLCASIFLSVKREYSCGHSAYLSGFLGEPGPARSLGEHLASQVSAWAVVMIWAHSPDLQGHSRYYALALSIYWSSG